TTLGAFFGALYELRTDEFDHCLLGAVALAPAEANNAGVTAVALAEASAQFVEQLLDGCRSFEERSSLTAGVQRVALAKRDHLLDERLHGLGLRNCGHHALIFDDAGHEVLQERIARSNVALEFISTYSMSHDSLCFLSLIGWAAC